MLNLIDVKLYRNLIFSDFYFFDEFCAELIKPVSLTSFQTTMIQLLSPFPVVFGISLLERTREQALTLNCVMSIFSSVCSFVSAESQIYIILI